MSLDITAPTPTKARKGLAIWSTGLAIFAMFFGAGNIVFPLTLGQFTQDKTLFGILGLIITAVFVPLAGLLSMMLYHGDYTSFFRRIGKIPGFLVTATILGIIGPFGGIPRCITISCSTLDALHLPLIGGFNLPLFSLTSCLLLFLATYRPRRILGLLGYVLTPLLLITLGLIVVKGFLHVPPLDLSPYTPWETFSKGVLEGYNTLDLLAAFFFSSVVILCLKKNTHETPSLPQKVPFTALWGGLLAAALLSFIYICFTFLAAGYSSSLADIPSDQLLGKLAFELLGPHAGVIAGLAVSFACFTTEIALTAIFAGFLQKTLLREKISYTTSLILTLGGAFVISTLHFGGISAFLVPIAQICYPALIVLSILNILHKLYNFKPVKSFFYGTLGLSLLFYFL